MCRYGGLLPSILIPYILRLLWSAYWPVMEEPLRSTLPPVFDGVEMTPAPPYPPSFDADGNLIGGLY